MNYETVPRDLNPFRDTQSSSNLHGFFNNASLLKDVRAKEIL